MTGSAFMLIISKKHLVTYSLIPFRRSNILGESVEGTRLRDSGVSIASDDFQPKVPTLNSNHSFKSQLERQLAFPLQTLPQIDSIGSASDLVETSPNISRRDLVKNKPSDFVAVDVRSIKERSLERPSNRDEMYDENMMRCESPSKSFALPRDSVDSIGSAEDLLLRQNGIRREMVRNKPSLHVARGDTIKMRSLEKPANVSSTNDLHNTLSVTKSANYFEESANNLDEMHDTGISKSADDLLHAERSFSDAEMLNRKPSKYVSLSSTSRRRTDCTPPKTNHLKPVKVRQACPYDDFDKNRFSSASTLPKKDSAIDTPMDDSINTSFEDDSMSMIHEDNRGNLCPPLQMWAQQEVGRPRSMPLPLTKGESPNPPTRSLTDGCLDRHGRQNQMNQPKNNFDRVVLNDLPNDHPIYVNLVNRAHLDARTEDLALVDSSFDETTNEPRYKNLVEIQMEVRRLSERQACDSSLQQSL